MRHELVKALNLAPRSLGWVVLIWIDGRAAQLEIRASPICYCCIEINRSRTLCHCVITTVKISEIFFPHKIFESWCVFCT